MLLKLTHKRNSYVAYLFLVCFGGLKMLIDFCNQNLVKSITCSASECEGHAVSNLISDNELLRKNGFLVDYFIKPPVTVHIKFVSEIKLNHLIVWPRVGSQKTSGIEILSSRCGNVFNSAASGSIKNNESGFVFYKYSDTNVKSISPDNFLCRTFKSDRYLQTTYLQIRIFRTLGSSIPALQKIEIWGEVSSNCSKETIDMVLHVWSKFKNVKKSETVVKICHNSDSKGKGSHIEPLIDVSNLHAPDEYLDAITNEIMILPMILPSGNIIDNTTLEKYINEESKWGRLPSDPFTGKLFTKTSNPKLSVALKARIDKFLVDNCDKKYIKCVPRTVGIDKFATGPRTSSLMACGNSVLNNRNNETMHEYQIDKQLQFDGEFKNSKRKLLNDCDFHNVKLNSCDTKVNVKSSSTSCTETSASKKFVSDNGSYDKLKEQSLDFALKSTLSNLPSFSNCNFISNTVSCCKCVSCNNLYHLPCNHYICRSCLCIMIETKFCKCSLCAAVFGSNDPKKIHVV